MAVGNLIEFAGWRFYPEPDEAPPCCPCSRTSCALGSQQVRSPGKTYHGHSELTGASFAHIIIPSYLSGSRSSQAGCCQPPAYRKPGKPFSSIIRFHAGNTAGRSAEGNPTKAYRSVTQQLLSHLSLLCFPLQGNPTMILQSPCRLLAIKQAGNTAGSFSPIPFQHLPGRDFLMSFFPGTDRQKTYLP